MKRSYTVSYEAINKLSYLCKSFPTGLINKSKYFKSLKDIFWRITALEDKYKTLINKIIDTKVHADNLVLIKRRGGVEALEDVLKKGKSGFSSVSYYSDGKTINFGTKRIDPLLQDYITRYSELLEILKCMLADLFNDKLGAKESFNAFVSHKDSKIGQLFDFEYLRDFNKYLWNEQKHQSDVSMTPFIYDGNILINPKLRAEGRFKKSNMDDFLSESLDSLIKLVEFIHNNSKVSQ